jgi:hypothetical protein
MAVWNKEEPYRKRGQSKYALGDDFGNRKQLGNLIPNFRFNLNPPDKYQSS